MEERFFNVLKGAGILAMVGILLFLFHTVLTVLGLSTPGVIIVIAVLFFCEFLGRYITEWDKK